MLLTRRKAWLVSTLETEYHFTSHTKKNFYVSLSLIETLLVAFLEIKHDILFHIWLIRVSQFISLKTLAIFNSNFISIQNYLISKSKTTFFWAIMQQPLSWSLRELGHHLFITFSCFLIAFIFYWVSIWI